MSQRIGTLVHPTTGVVVETYKGFSWPAFFFAWCWLMYKGMYVEGLVTLILYFIFPGISSLLVALFWGFRGNSWHIERLFASGFKLPVKDIGVVHGE